MSCVLSCKQSGQNQVNETNLGDSFTAAMDKTTSFVSLLDLAAPYVDELVKMAGSVECREDRLLAQQLATEAITDLVNLPSMGSPADHPEEFFAFQTLLNFFLSVHDQWVSDTENGHPHLFREVPTVCYRGTDDAFDDYVYADYLHPTEEDSELRLFFRFPNNAVSEPVAYFISYDENDEEKRVEYDFGDFSRLDIKSAPNSKVVYGSQEVLDLMLESSTVLFVYKTDMAPNETYSGRDSTMLMLGGFKEKIHEFFD